jgi:hypothetical protein
MTDFFFKLYHIKSFKEFESAFDDILIQDSMHTVTFIFIKHYEYTTIKTLEYTRTKNVFDEYYLCSNDGIFLRTADDIAMLRKFFDTSSILLNIHIIASRALTPTLTPIHVLPKLNYVDIYNYYVSNGRTFDFSVDDVFNLNVNACLELIKCLNSKS